MSRTAAFVLMSGILFTVETSLGQVEKPMNMMVQRDFVMTGNARVDLIQSLTTATLLDSIPGHTSKYDAQKKSALLAGALSLAVPGAGEIYATSYWRAGGFVLAETGLWVFYAAYMAKGNNQTTLFQNFADAHWSVVRYAQWIQANLTELNPDITTGFTGYLIPGTQNLPPWQQVDWNKLNNIENLIAQKVDNAFTHLLPHRPDQQYYELIGKYPQFASGWEDATGISPQDIVKSNVSPMFLNYSHMRGKANDFYNIATTGAILLVVNHVFSALDAAWSASQFNDRLKLEAHLEPTFRSVDFVEFVPTAKLTLSF